MPKNSYYSIKDLNLDLQNYRTVNQQTESGAITALISISKDNFIAILNDIIDEGYSVTENIIVLNDGGKYIVKEGNRRVAACKLIHQLHILDDFDLDETTKAKIRGLSKEWLKANSTVPCSVFEISEIEQVKKIVSRIHGKKQETSREKWGSVATARLNREENGGSEPGLTLLEKYLMWGTNLTQDEKSKWGGDYGLSVLDLLINRVYVRLGYSSRNDIIDNYPKINYRKEVEKMMHDIGHGHLTHRKIRETDFMTGYGIPDPNAPKEETVDNTSNNNSQGGESKSTNADDAQNSTASNNGSNPNSSTESSNNNAEQGQDTNTSSPGNSRNESSKYRIYLIPRSFNVRILNPKVNTIRDEFYSLNIQKHTNAGAVLFRVLVELSVDSYIENKGLTDALTASSSGYDLRKKIGLVTNHLESTKVADSKGTICKGIRAELKDKDGVFHVDTLHAYIHSNRLSPKYENLNIAWDNISDFMRILWEQIK
ncbi:MULTISPECIES: hypothetical protein [unclassified Flavobacterium]|uniref:hypothetical protein n=1 Tax=unclassified Flavobacterium TaxID=196869 RepID=UPI001F12D2BA|nr:MULTISPECIES: hypothetical protein [unclassified Flavobacterium]UMY64854.1 hypothetical protein MKO97_10055 [Flavobacterium sp. HJ-32-4]